MTCIAGLVLGAIACEGMYSDAPSESLTFVRGNNQLQCALTCGAKALVEFISAYTSLCLNLWLRARPSDTPERTIYCHIEW